MTADTMWRMLEEAIAKGILDGTVHIDLIPYAKDIEERRIRLEDLISDKKRSDKRSA